MKEDIRVELAPADLGLERPPARRGARHRMQHLSRVERTEPKEWAQSTRAIHCGKISQFAVLVDVGPELAEPTMGRYLAGVHEILWRFVRKVTKVRRSMHSTMTDHVV